MLYQIPKQELILGVLTSKKEIHDLVKAWAAITLAFTILLNGTAFDLNTLYVMIIAAITVGSGFLLHELAHKFVAQRYHCWAEFRSSDMMLGIAIISSFFGFLFAAPGAVVIDARGTTKRQNGLISLAGPATNFVLSAVFFSLGALMLTAETTTGFSFSQQLVQYGAYINVWLGLFNLIPFGPFDGQKIFSWNKPVWGAALFLGIVLYKLTMIS